MRVPIIYMVGRSVCPHRPHDYPEDRIPMTTIPACDVLPGMVIRTAFDPQHFSGAIAVATFRVASVDEFDGAVCIHADSPSSRIFEIPDYVQVQVLKWPSYAHEAVDIAPEVLQSWQEAPDLDTAITAFKRGGVL